MWDRQPIHAIVLALAAALTMKTGGAVAADANYPDWKGQWVPVKAAGVAARSLDPTKPAGP